MLTTKKPNCEQIIDILPEPFVIIDRDYKILAANRAYRNHYGVENDDLLGRHCYEVSHRVNAPCSQHGERCPLEEVLNTGKPCQVIHAHYDKDDNEEYVQLQAMPIVDEDGEVVYIGEYVRILSQADKDAGLLVGRSPTFLKMSNLLQRVAPTQSTVLLQGENGVGKEKVATYIHFHSKRCSKPFVIMDSGMLDENFIESELFGAEKDADTSTGKIGLFEAANGGTLFIDEICELSLPLQTKLLRALESGTIRRIGSNEHIDIDVRIIAATNRDMQRMVAEGQFRQDLYYRLSAFPVHIPPLRNRREDIIALTEHFLANQPGGRRHIPLSSEVVGKLLEHDFPGNIRELRNTIERAAILACDDRLTPAHIVLEDGNIFNNEQEKARQAIEHLIQRRGRLTEQMVLDALTQCDGHRARAAQLLHVSERTLYRHIKRLKID